MKRKDGSSVASWDVVRTEEEVIDVFPRSVKTPERKMGGSEAERKVRICRQKGVGQGRLKELQCCRLVGATRGLNRESAGPAPGDRGTALRDMRQHRL